VGAVGAPFSVQQAGVGRRAAWGAARLEFTGYASTSSLSARPFPVFLVRSAHPTGGAPVPDPLSIRQHVARQQAGGTQKAGARRSSSASPLHHQSIKGSRHQPFKHG